MGLKDRSRSRIRRATVCLAGVALLGAPGLTAVTAATSASAAPAPVPSLAEYSVGGNPFDLAVGSDGNMWTPIGGRKVSQVTPGGVVSQFPTSRRTDTAVITTGSDGNLWYVAFDGFIYRLSTAGTVTGRFRLPSANNGAPNGITLGPDGNVWVAENFGLIARVTPSGEVTEFDPPGDFPVDVTSGPDGNVWYSDSYIDEHQVGRITPTTGEITTFDAPPGINGWGPERLTVGPDHNIWYTDGTDGLIGRVTPSGVFTQFYMPDNTHPSFITAGPDGALWFTATSDSGQSGQVGRITTDGQVGVASTPSRPQGIVVGPDARLWMAMYDEGAVGAFPPFTPAPSQPDVRRITPPDGTAKGGTTVVITGYDVGFATQVLFGDTPAASFTPIGPGQVQAVVPPHPTGEVDVTVVTPYGTTQSSAGSRFFISSPDCGMVVAKNTTLKADLGPCYHDGIVVTADGVNLSLGGHRIFGFPEPSDGHSVGIRLPGRSNVKIVGGTVSGFDAGIVIRGGGSNSVSGMTVKDNLGVDFNDPNLTEFGDGILILSSSRNRITGNTVSHNGHFDGIGVFDVGSDGNVISGNVVENTVGPSNTGPAGEGIIVNGSSGRVVTFVSDNKITGNTVRNNASGGISNTNSVASVIADNTVTGNGTTNSFGNGIGVTVGFNWDQRPTKDVVTRNQVHGNGADGIRVGGLSGFSIGAATGNTITNNDAADNAKHPEVDRYEGSPQGFDLHELHETPGCLNTWSGNTWGSAFYAPDCTASGGSGPTPPAAVAATAAASQSAVTAPAVPATNRPTGPGADVWQTFFDGGRHWPGP